MQLKWVVKKEVYKIKLLQLFINSLNGARRIF